MEASLAAALARAKASGAVAGRVDPATAARSLVCLVEGMRVVGKTGPDRALSQAVVRSVVEGLTR